MPKKLLVTAQWDDESNMWVATSDDIPGLVTEAGTLDSLLERVLAVTPELMNDNGHHLAERVGPGEIFDICIFSQVRMQTGHAA
ncbi:MAG: DUF1902 domain-containing protein [Caulobacteraceae bacterium]|nr:MAG: DUF1902 domain-containing protein [Caulobacteraceae bacterium]